MGISKLPSGSWQARLRGTDGRVVSKTFRKKRDAESQLGKWKDEKQHGLLASTALKITVDTYFLGWHKDAPKNASDAWRKQQKKSYNRFIQPIIGNIRLSRITSLDIAKVLNQECFECRQPTKLKVYILLRQIFKDAIELYQYRLTNPVLRTMKPKVPIRETKHLDIDALKVLLNSVHGCRYQTAIWLQVFMGLRVGEIQGLHWEDINFASAVLTVRRAYVNKAYIIKDYPKGRREHSHVIPKELLVHLKSVYPNRTGVFVTGGREGRPLSYSHYRKFLRDRCKKLGLVEIGTHGLRHSSAELYMAFGATREDMQQLFAHTDASVTDRYIHCQNGSLGRVQKSIQLFGDHETTTRSKVRNLRLLKGDADK